MKTYYIYYLPNAVRDYGNGKILYGKIGCTDNYHKRVIYQKSFTPRFGKLDITGHHVLETVIGTKKEAEAIEYAWQANFILVDGNKSVKSDEHKRKIGKMGKLSPRKGKPGLLHTEETKQKMRESALRRWANKK
jgi:hypothetical protein